MAGAHNFYLWAWENRDPNRVIESVTLEPADRKFVVAAITLGFNDEAPFPRSAKREVKITLPQPEDAGKPFNLEVEVDRGVATFPFPLPEKPAERISGGRLQRLGRGAKRKVEPGLCRGRRHPLGHGHGEIRGRGNRSGELGRA